MGLEVANKENTDLAANTSVSASSSSTSSGLISKMEKAAEEVETASTTKKGVSWAEGVGETKVSVGKEQVEDENAEDEDEYDEGDEGDEGDEEVDEEYEALLEEEKDLSDDEVHRKYEAKLEEVNQLKKDKKLEEALAISETALRRMYVVLCLCILACVV